MRFPVSLGYATRIWLTAVILPPVLLTVAFSGALLTSFGIFHFPIPYLQKKNEVDDDVF